MVTPAHACSYIFIALTLADHNLAANIGGKYWREIAKREILAGGSKEILAGDSKETLGGDLVVLRKSI